MKMSNSAYACKLCSNSTPNSRHSTLKHVKPQHPQQHLLPPPPRQLPSPLPSRHGRSLFGTTRNPFLAAQILTYAPDPPAAAELIDSDDDDDPDYDVDADDEEPASDDTDASEDSEDSHMSYESGEDEVGGDASDYGGAAGAP